MRILTFIVMGIVLLSACKKDSPKAPEKADLIAPAKNSECTPVQDDGANSSLVRFNWKASDHTENYELRVKNLNTDAVFSKSTTGTVEIVSLDKGTPFSWQVITTNSGTNTATESDVWLFYNPGSQTDHVPFPAEIISPVQGSTAFKDINNKVSLKWSGFDLDGDIVGFKVYFSTENPPTDLLSEVKANVDEVEVGVASNTLYFWKVVTTDGKGNISTSDISEFKTR
ncbi:MULTISPECIES: hypothetical protein [Zobellia]|uniref:Fibronectin type-III repeats protein n=1 Tax=Zobellia galactanivorans (strain DSM 12802 / CCUG 47099 / CIP 106680 / NCIMB 13871 / Dsij) TaxID=63186 RepID=G0L5I2_ZOBGA|nr:MULTISPECIES: hypothetical protein [Zobellia]MBU3025930.1 hypothetical protein [Zobellia galactanivorans]CAZ96296.1 Fibronectin type-III repeats protein [Zobellia galactanivorans]